MTPYQVQQHQEGLNFRPARLHSACTNRTLCKKENNPLQSLRMRCAGQEAWGCGQGRPRMRWGVGGGSLPLERATQFCSLSGRRGGSGSMPDISLRFSEFLVLLPPCQSICFFQAFSFPSPLGSRTGALSFHTAFFNVYHIISISSHGGELNFNSILTLP